LVFIVYCPEVYNSSLFFRSIDKDPRALGDKLNWALNKIFSGSELRTMNAIVHKDKASGHILKEINNSAPFFSKNVKVEKRKLFIQYLIKNFHGFWNDEEH
jgi:hypothetical protein